MTDISTLTILGLESSCDETAAAVVRGDRTILSNVVYSQMKEHIAYGGVVPEIAARAHVVHMDDVVQAALDQAQMTLAQVDAIAVTSGPGLIGGVIVGVMTAKALAAVTQKPLLGINHLEGHALTARLTNDVAFPFLLLLVSGGHCQTLLVRGVGDYERLGGTLDDAAGEAFDKVAKMLGLPYPGGPQVEREAAKGDAARFAFKAPLLGTPHCDFSFSGLKTGVLRQIELLKASGATLDDATRADICAAFQASVGDAVVDRMRQAYALCAVRGVHTADAPLPLVVAGGVAANKYLRTRLETLCATQNASFIAPPLKLCTDNAAMIAWAGLERLRAGLFDAAEPIEPRARWPLCSLVSGG